jgi:hypothetical protein
VALACSSPSQPAGESALVKLRKSIATYEQSPSDARGAQVEVGFAELDTEIAKLRATEAASSGEAKSAAAKRVEELDAERYELRNRYAKAIVAGKMKAVGDAMKSHGEKMGKGLEAAGQKMQDAARPERTAGAGPPNGLAVGGDDRGAGVWRRPERLAVLDWEAEKAFHAAYELPSCRSKEDVA